MEVPFEGAVQDRRDESIDADKDDDNEQQDDAQSYEQSFSQESYATSLEAGRLLR